MERKENLSCVIKAKLKRFIEAQEEQDKPIKGRRYFVGVCAYAPKTNTYYSNFGYKLKPRFKVLSDISVGEDVLFFACFSFGKGEKIKMLNFGKIINRC